LGHLPWTTLIAIYRVIGYFVLQRTFAFGNPPKRVSSLEVRKLGLLGPHVLYLWYYWLSL